MNQISVCNKIFVLSVWVYALSMISQYTKNLRCSLVSVIDQTRELERPISGNTR